MEDVDMSGLMDGKVRLILLQFSFSNINLIPKGIKEEGEESIVDFTVRSKDQLPGVEVLSSSGLPFENKVGCLSIVSDLAEAGYVLVDAFSEIRNRKGKRFAMVRFVFCEEEHANISKESLVVKTNAMAALEKLAGDATWKVTAFLNHYFLEGILIEDVFALSVNFAGREPLVDGAGKLICRWEKDESGERIGDAPIPISPQVFLRIRDGGLIFSEEAYEEAE